MHKESPVHRKRIVPQLIAVKRRLFGEAYVVVKAVHNFLD
jgi:hypothetical protein